MSARYLSLLIIRIRGFTKIPILKNKISNDS